MASCKSEFGEGTRFVFLKFLVFMGLSLFGKILLAQDGSFTSIHHQYQESRALGMGDAFTAVGDDYSTLFYNPAGLAFLETWQFNGSLDFNVSSNFLSFNKNLSNATSSNSGDTSAQYRQMAEFLQGNYGNVYGTRTGLLHGIYTRPRWGIALLPSDLKLELSVINQGIPGISARAVMDTTLAMGYAREIKPVRGRLAWGTTLKFINRGYFSKQVNALDLLIDSNIVKTSDMREGYTLDADIGTLYKPDLPDEGFWSYFQLARPSFAFVARNVFDYGFGRTFKLLNKQADINNPPEKLYRVFDLGSKWEYPKAWIFGGRGVFDVRDIGHPNFTWRKGLHLGFEFDWKVKSWWKGAYRVGLSQLYLTGGLSMMLGVFRLDVATYSEDVGSSTSPKENRYYQAKLNLDI